MSVNVKSKYPEIKMIKNSLTHNILMITKFYAKKITVSDLHVINNTAYRNKSKVSRSLLKLALDNLVIIYDDDSWIITNKGIAYLYDFAALNKTHHNQQD